MKTKTQFPIILLTVLAMTACGGSDDGAHATQKRKMNDTRPQKILQLKKFLGPSFWHLFRNDTCEHSKRTTGDSWAISSPALVAHFINSDTNCVSCIEHQIIRIYLTETEGLHFVEVSTSTQYSRAHQNSGITAIYTKRSDGRKCRPVLDTVFDPYTTLEDVDPDWDLRNDELIIRSPIEMRLKKIGDRFYLYASAAARTVEVSPAHSSVYPMPIGVALYNYAPDNMPYCPKQPDCDAP